MRCKTAAPVHQTGAAVFYPHSKPGKFQATNGNNDFILATIILLQFHTKVLYFQHQDIIDWDLYPVLQYQQTLIFLNFADLPRMSEVSAALFPRILHKIGDGYRRMGIPLLCQPPEPVVENGLLFFCQIDPLFCHPACFLKDTLISSQCSKGRKLGRPIMGRHLWVALRDMVRHRKQDFI